MGYNVQAEAALKTRIRLKCGSPDTTLLTADQLDDALDEALEVVNRLQPRRRMSSLTTVANQQDYRIAYDGGGLSNFRRVTDVLYEQTNIGYVAALDVNLASPEIAAMFTPLGNGISLFDNPALTQIYYDKVQLYNDVWGGKWEQVEKDDGTYIRLIDAPSDAGDTVVFFYTENRTLANLESRFEEPLLKLAVGYCKQIVAEKLDQIGSVDHGHRKQKFSGQLTGRSAQDWIDEGKAAISRPNPGGSF